MEKFKVIESNGKKLVLKKHNRMSVKTNSKFKKSLIAPMPNYGNTGMCLCGILKPGQSIEEFSALYQLKKKGYSK